jgi:hypothetical protein
MSFEEEWAQHKAAGAESLSMRLNGDPDRPPSGPANGDLKVDQSDLAAVGDAAYDIHTRLSKDGKHADDATSAAGTTLSGEGLALGPALSKLSTEWSGQLSTLLAACGHISNHLDYTKNAHAGDEQVISTSFSIIQLEEGFNEREQL